MQAVGRLGDELQASREEAQRRDGRTAHFRIRNARAGADILRLSDLGPAGV